MSDIDARCKDGPDLRSFGDLRLKKSPSNDSHVCLHFLDGTEFGVLNTQLSKALGSLVQKPGVEFDVIISVQAIKDIIGRVTKAVDAVVRVNINVFGPSHDREEVGLHLSSHRIFLQHPDKLRSGSTYSNPQVIRFPGLNASDYEIQSKVGTDRTSKTDAAKVFNDAITNVYSSLTRGSKLSKVEGDRRLKTALLP
jgi:SWI/SNF-related matrix-associated actin-dependent regulator of chromatin subfamily A3